MKKIESKSNPLVKQARKIITGLLDKSQPVICVEGYKLINEALSSGLEPQRLFIMSPDESHSQNFPAENVFLIGPAIMKELTSLQSPPSAIAFFKPRPEPELSVFLAKARCVVALDRVQDPGNTGTIIRTAEAMGADAVILFKESCSPFNLKVIRAAMGSSFRLPVFADVCPDVFFTIAKTNKFTAICADMNGQCLVDFSFPGKTALVFGQEGKGLSQKILKVCTSKLAIPMQGKVESLNVALATAICLYEWRRGIKSQ